MIYWHIVSSEMYRNGSPIDGHMYFLTDTREIYRGTEPFTESVIVYNGILPVSPALNRLYINSETLEGKIWQGTEVGWKTVIHAVSDTVADIAGTPVSGKAVTAYVAAEIAKLASSKDTVSSLSWDSSNHLLAVTKGDDSVENIVFDGLGVGLNYNAQTGDLTMVDASGNTIGTSVKLDLERFVTSAEYDATRKTIILYFDQEKTDYIEIPVTDLVDTYTAQAIDNSLNLTVENNVIKGSVKISTSQGNLITVDENGLYVAPIDLSGKMDKVADAVDGNVAIFGQDGQVVDSGKTLDDILSNSSIYQGASIEEAVTGHTPVKGDYCIVKKQIGTSGKYEHTAYYYDGAAWVAFDGNYSAENVFFPEDLVTTFAIGRITLSNGSATINAAGKNLIDTWNSIFVQEKNPTTTQPSVNITFNQAKAYEVGTVVTPSYTAKLNAGSYTYGPETGVTATEWAISNTDGGSATTNSGSFDAITVEDNTNYKITATATYGDGAVPVTNQNNPYTAGQIKAGSKSATSAAITGYRNGFYGTLTTKPETMTSDIIRSLASKSNANPVAGNVWNITVPVGAMRVVFAYPATVEDVKSVLDVNGLNAEIKGAFSMVQVDVEGANGHQAIPYKVYYLDYASANDVANTYKVTL